MRFRSVVLPAAVALAAVVAVPSSASAAAQCGVLMPSKVVIDDATVVTDMTLTSGCFRSGAEHANWDVWHLSTGFGYENNFTSEDLADGPYWTWSWQDDEPMGRWVTEATGAATADGTALTQNDVLTIVKYDSRLSTRITRTSTGLRWAATATQWSGRSHKYVVRPHVNVGLFHQTRSGADWTYVKSVRTSSAGTATVSLTTAKTGNYRLVVGETPSVWASYSRTVAGRI